MSTVVVKILLTEWKFDVELDIAKKETWEETCEARAITMARKMIARNKPVDEVVEFTGLEIADIVMLQSEIVNA